MIPTSFSPFITNSAPTFLSAIISIALNTVASGPIEKTVPLFWFRIAPICPLTSMAAEKGNQNTTPPASDAKEFSEQRNRWLPRKFSINQTSQILGYGRLIQPLNHFVHEAGDEEALGGFYRNAAGTEIKHFVFVDLSGSGAVGATDV